MRTIFCGVKVGKGEFWDGEALWESRYSKTELRQKESEMGKYMFAGLYQQRPAPLEGGIVKREWFRFYDPPAPQGMSEWIQSRDITL